MEKKLKYGISLKIPREFDRRFKLTEQDILLIKEYYNTKQYSTAELARKYSVAHTTIMYYVDEEYNRKMKEKNAKHRSTDKERYNENKQRNRNLIRDIVRTYTKLQVREFRKK